MKSQTCLKDFFKYTSLNILGMIGVSFYILADTFFVSKGLGIKGLAALNLALPLYSFMDGCGLMIGMGGGTKYSIQKSTGNDTAANRIFTNAVMLSTLFSAFFMLTACLFLGSILSFFGARGEVLTLSKTYLSIILLFAPAFLLNYMLLAFVRNDGAPQLSMAAMIGGSLSNVFLDWVFIFPCRMGIFGASLATGLAPVISILILSPHLIRKKNGFHFIRCKASLRLFFEIITTGIPSLITEMSSAITMIVFNSIMLRLKGNVGVAAYSVIANLSLVVIAIYNGLAQGTQPLISSNYGIQNKKNIHSLLRYALTAVFLLSAVVYTVIFFGAGQITSLFNSEHDLLLQSIATEGLRLYFTACPFAGFNVIMSIYFSSIERPAPAHIISILRGFVIIVPMAFLLSAIANINGAWCAFPVTEFLTALIGLFLLLKSLLATP